MKTNSPLLRFFLLLICMLPIANTFAVEGDEEPLDPDMAFAINPSVQAADMIRLEWNIAPGYYMYKDKFKFTSETPGIRFGDITFPKGKVKTDEFFGKVETYRNKIQIDIPIIRSSDASNELKISAVSQGCADIGVCYNPHTQKVALTLAQQDAGSSKPAKSVLKSFGQKLGIIGEDVFQPLPPEQAFIFSSEILDNNTLLARWDIAEGYYLYRDKFQFTLTDENGVTLGMPVFPKGKIKVDEAFGRMEVYYKQVEIRLPLNRPKLEKTDVKLETVYQGCADEGFCYPPMDASSGLSLPIDKVAMTTATANSASDLALSEEEELIQALSKGNIIWTILVFYGLGLLLTFTPCVFPMIPILSNIIVGEGENVTTRKAFIMSLVYVLAMAATYTIAGVVAGYFGQNLQAAFQNFWVLTVFSLIFVALALSMFGYYEIQLPSSLQSKLAEMSNRQQGGKLVGVGIMGFLSALIVGPCVAPPLAAALIYIGQTGNAALGGTALFALSMGMGTPLVAIGTLGGHFLPRAGSWMDTVKMVFGIVLLGVAIWMLERVLPPATTMSLWAVLLIASAILMLFSQSFSHAWRYAVKGLGVLFIAYGIMIFSEINSGGQDPLAPFQRLVGMQTIPATQGMVKPSQSTIPGLDFKKVKGYDEAIKVLNEAKQQGKPVFIDIIADWCVYCKQMDKYTFGDEKVQTELRKFQLLKIDITDNSESDKKILQHLKINTPPPVFLFINPTGDEIPKTRVYGYKKADAFLQRVNRAQSLM